MTSANRGRSSSQSGSGCRPSRGSRRRSDRRPRRSAAARRRGWAWWRRTWSCDPCREEYHQQPVSVETGSRGGARVQVEGVERPRSTITSTAAAWRRPQRFDVRSPIDWDGWELAEVAAGGARRGRSGGRGGPAGVPGVGGARSRRPPRGARPRLADAIDAAVAGAGQGRVRRQRVAVRGDVAAGPAPGGQQHPLLRRLRRASDSTSRRACCTAASATASAMTRAGSWRSRRRGTRRSCSPPGGSAPRWRRATRSCSSRRSGRR